MPVSSLASAVVSVPRVDCWDCGEPTPIDRRFCKHCGVRLEAGSSSAATDPAGPTAGPAGTPLGPTSFGPLPLDSGRRGHFGLRRVGALTASLFLAAALGVAALHAATSVDPDNLGSAPEPLTPGDAQVAAAPGDDEPVAAAVQETRAPERGGGGTSPEPQPVVQAEPKPKALPVADSRPLEATQGPGRTAIRRNGWVCEGGLSIEDLTSTRWSVRRVSFLVEDGYERVVLHLDRGGPDRGEPAVVSAELLTPARVASRFPNLPRPSVGKSAVVLDLQGGISATLGLRGYRPRGLSTLKEFSAIRSPNGSSKLLLSLAGDSCFRLRIPVWDGGSSASKAQVQIDVKP